MSKKWIIPDIHGCAYTLQILIDNQIEPAKDDLLIFLGDYIDRGPDSKGVIDYIMKLEDEGFNVRTLMGNHEDYCLQAWEIDKKKSSLLGFRFKSPEQREWEKRGGKQALMSFGVSSPRDIPLKYIEWMQKLEFYTELDDFFIAHAGFNFKLDDPFTDKHAMIWIREFTVQPEKINNKRLIHGHVPVNLDLIYQAIQSGTSPFIPLDNGIYFKKKTGFGNLMALELTEMELISQTLLDEVNYRGE
ncbi:MAG: metallophosphoesterase [Bacteroidales bacterium]|nr:metallophosphoesterase [Bacteroidales bacterium]